MSSSRALRNVAIVAHVDHGKTTLLDAVRKSTGGAAEQGGIARGGGAFRVPRSESLSAGGGGGAGGEESGRGRGSRTGAAGYTGSEGVLMDARKMVWCAATASARVGTGTTAWRTRSTWCMSGPVASTSPGSSLTTPPIITGHCAPGERKTSAHVRWEISCVTSKNPLAEAPRACTTRSGIRSLWKLASFSVSW